MEFTLLIVLLMFGLYILGFIIPKHLKDISGQLEDIKELLKGEKKAD